LQRIKGSDVYKFVIAILVCQIAGFIGSIFTRSSIFTWYPTLIKPYFTPPDRLFAPIWISLYILIGIATFLVWQRGFHHQVVRRALALFGVQLILNALWSFFFFGLKSPLAGLIEIAILGIAIILTIRSFLQISRTAGLLLIPYFLWVTFATGLNLSIWYLNC
jgi:tryptophan-rich sensory protein